MRHMICAAALASVLAGPAWANIVYEVDIPQLQGGGLALDVSGTIITDGALGQIDESNVVSWEVNFVGAGFDLTLSSATASYIDEQYLFAYYFQATEDSLFIDGWFEMGEYGDSTTDGIYFQFSSNQFKLTYDLSPESFFVFEDGEEVSPGLYAFGVAAPSSPVPLPGALALLGAGLGALGLAGRRRAA